MENKFLNAGKDEVFAKKIEKYQNFGFGCCFDPFSLFSDLLVVTVEFASFFCTFWRPEGPGDEFEVSSVIV